MAVRHSVLSSEASKVTEGLLGLHAYIIVVLTVLKKILSVKWLFRARGGMKTSVGGVLSEKIRSADINTNMDCFMCISLKTASSSFE